MKISSAQLDEYFCYHAPKEGQPLRYAAIRRAAREFAGVLVDNTMPGADQSAAIRELRLCVMTANASIALEL